MTDAVREFSAAVRLNPKRPDIRTFQGFAYSLSDRPAEGVKRLRKLHPLTRLTRRPVRLAQALARSRQPKQLARRGSSFASPSRKT
jgi:hypothetical protein